MTRKKHVDPLPEEFASYEEAAEFWDTHDTTDYPEAFQTVEVETEFRAGTMRLRLPRMLSESCGSGLSNLVFQ
jgi:hypothetical protein